MENYYLDQAVQLQYQVMENRTPYYGYASYTYNRAAAGTRLIQGTFAINFRDTYYIYKLLDLIKGREEVISGNRTPDPKTFKTIKQALNGDLTLEDFLKQADSGHDTSTQLKVLHTVADGLTSALWGDPSDTGLAVSPNKPLFDVGPNGFSIYIRYGEPLVQPQQLRSNINNPLDLNQRIQDLQDPLNSVPAQRVATHSVGTVHRLVGVEITGTGQTINDQGQNVLEVYTFMAKDIDEAGS
jgi:hypothetical protein